MSSARVIRAQRTRPTPTEPTEPALHERASTPASARPEPDDSQQAPDRPSEHAQGHASLSEIASLLSSKPRIQRVIDLLKGRARS